MAGTLVSSFWNSQMTKSGGRQSWDDPPTLVYMETARPDGTLFETETFSHSLWSKARSSTTALCTAT